MPEISIEQMPKRFAVNDNLILRPDDFENTEVERGPNIKPFPVNTAMKNDVEGSVLIKCEDNITTDHIMPSNAKLLPYRSNIPYLSDYCLAPVDPDFSDRAKKNGGGFIVAGANYGQGSSREHAALVPLYLGIKGVIAKSFARIHKDNLINNGILPLVFENESDYEKIGSGDRLKITDARRQIESGDTVIVENVGGGYKFKCVLALSERLKKTLLSGGVLAANAAENGK